MILLRCAQIDEPLLRFAESLARIEIGEVVFAVDESRGISDARGFRKVSITPSALQSLELYVPHDAAWRCGDYALYLAMQELNPQEEVWLIESDVRISEMEHFFNTVVERAGSIDFLTAHLRPAEQGWYWRQYALSRDTPPYRCFFPVTRYTPTAVTYLQRVRRAQTRSISRRAVWPNDEAFVATTLMASRLACADFNDVVSGAWTPESFQFAQPVRGETFVPPRRPHLWHPILFDAAYDAKVERLRDDAGHRFGTRLVRKLHRPLLRRAAWCGSFGLE